MAAGFLHRCLYHKLPTLKTIALVVHVLVLLQLTTHVPVGASTYDQFEETYDLGYKVGTNQHIVTLQHMVQDVSTGSIYVGSVNRLYKLSSNLSVEVVNITGPVQDTTGCRPPPATCDDERISTNNINKVLVMDDERNELITCGTIYQGFCNVRRLDDLHIVEESSIEVAANTEQGTNVAFIAPGPSGSANLLYTAVSRAQWIRDVPTVAKRVLHVSSEMSGPKFDPLSEKQIPRSTITAESLFDINYIYGFSSGNFSYFIAIQLQDFEVSTSQLYTKIVRLCQEDSSASIHSYIELPLVCNHSEGIYNLAKSAYLTEVGSDLYNALGVQEGEDVLFVTFSSDSSTALKYKSIICMYPVKTINEMFVERVRDCATRGTHNTEISWLGNSDCTMSQLVLNALNESGANYCQTSDGNTPLGGLQLPINAQSIFSSSSAITAIAAIPHNAATVVLLGDDHGNIKKLRVQSLANASLYEEFAIVSGSPAVQNGLMFNTDKQYIYFMTETKITKVPIETCETRTTCAECLMVSEDVSDPHCGWCPLQTSCTRRSENECTGSTLGITNRWIEHTASCISVTSVIPPNIPSTSSAQLTLTVTSLPQVSNSSVYYECVFGNIGSTRIDIMQFSGGSSTVQCSTPADVPVLQGGNLTVPLSIRASETGRLIVNTTFDFYNCSAFGSCTECVADYMCNWCIFENQCLGNASTCNSSGIIAGEMIEDVGTTKKGRGFCPRIDNRYEILIPAGGVELVEVTVNVDNLPVQSGYECVLKHGDWMEDVITPAVTLNNTSISCSARKYNYVMDEQNVTADFYIRWNNGRFVLDNPHMISATLYKCAVKRLDCGKCLLSEDKFNCGWCERSAVCTLMTQCSISQGQGHRWLHGSDLCPDPKITSFNPISGHIAGGTRVTIMGFNLGQEVSDIKSITLAGVSCEMAEYRAAESIVCVTMASTAGSGPVEIMIGRDNTTTMTTSDENFSYVVPRIASFTPDLGPKSGGSRVTLLGTHLDAGDNRMITVAGSPCDIKEATVLSTSVSCTTSSSTAGVMGPVLMTFDLMGTAMSSSMFSYMADPTISSLTRTNVILSGGLNMPVTGTNLTVVQEPKMIFHFGTISRNTRTKRQTNEEITISTMCSTTSSTTMMCQSPDLKTLEFINAFTFNNNTVPPSFILPKTNFDFVMDGVQGLQSQWDLVVYVDPEYFMFEEKDNLKQQEYGERNILEIKGRYIGGAGYVGGDVTVKVGAESCESLMLKKDILTCQVPINTVGQIYNVVVYHGNLVVNVGRLEYLPEQLPMSIIIGAVCGGLILILIILFIVCIWHRISKNERRFKKMEQQRDEMEMRVAQECKDAFAELQITVLTVSSDVEGSGIPFRDYRDYVARVLFPYNPNHPVFRELPVVKENISGIKRDILHKGLVQFGNLISNHTFLTIFIRTLEAQKTLNLKDLSNVASLLIVALHSKLDFLTEAMKSMLQEQIKGYVKEGKPQLLLRRSEAVVEKLLSHWLSILMYDSLKNSMGKPLFHLFYAIKQQIDKGPVDAVTGEARYGLSEMKVIRQQIDFQTLNIFTNSLDITSEPIQLKVLDCDTISQTKDKILDAIYKSCPFSKRPTRDELDLEWSDRPQGPGSMILLDDDGRTRMDGEWKRINTLAHYQVPDGATLRLVRAQPNGGSLPNTPARKYGLGTLQTSPATSASPIIDQEKGTIQWHLVKHVDSGSLRKGERDQKMMAEIYLPRLLTTKGILQTFVDELLETIFNCDKYDSDVPLTIKYLFDFLDEQAATQGITNGDVAHAWKSNSLQLRFWVNLIMNPTILFDINKTDTVDACVSIIGQTLIDSCSVSEQYLTKDSPSNKLLYAKDIPTYKQWVARYYNDISEMATVSDQDMSAMLAAHTNRYQNEFQPLNALNELYFCYACIYKSEILQALDEDKEAQKQNLGDKLEDIFRLMADSA